MNWSELVKKYNPFRNYKSPAHWFTYHWRPVVCVILVCLVWLYFARMPKQADPDYVITWVGQQVLSQEEQQALTQLVQELGKDQNGDGAIVLRLDQYPITFSADGSLDTMSDSYNHLLKLLNVIQLNDCRLYLLEDPEGFQRTTGLLQFLDGTIPSEENGYECAQWEQMCLPFSTPGLEKTAYLGRRCIFDDTDPETQYPGADALFSALTSGGDQTSR